MPSGEQSHSSRRRLSRTAEFPALQALYEATSGVTWQRSDSWMSNYACTGTTPFFSTPSWYGVQSCYMGDVQRLVLGSNGLRGTIPTQIGALTSLSYWRLSR